MQKNTKSTDLLEFFKLVFLIHPHILDLLVDKVTKTISLQMTNDIIMIFLFTATHLVLLNQRSIKSVLVSYN